MAEKEKKKKKRRKRSAKDLLPSSNKIVNIGSYVTSDGNVQLQADGGWYRLPYYKGRAHFADVKAFVRFIKGVEKLIRQSDEYKAYIGFLKNEIGLNFCALLGNVTDDKAEIEMHHGPILTLFDYCAIVTDSMLARGENVSSFTVAKRVMQEHYENHVQVVMLSRTVHEQVHAGKIFIHPKMAWGDLNAFLERYADGLTREQIETINEYLEKAEVYGTTDGGTLGFDGIASWGRGGGVADMEE